MNSVTRDGSNLAKGDQYEKLNNKQANYMQPPSNTRN